MVENLGNIGDFVGGIGVVFTLVYLAFQIRASRLQTLAEDTTDAVRGWLDAQTRWLVDTESVNLIRRAFHDYEDLTPDEKGLFAGYMFNLNAAYQSALNLSRKGLLDPRQFSQIETSMAAYLKCPGVQDWWTEAKPFWPEHVGRRMDQIVAEYSGPPMSDAMSFYAPAN
jgi:hypothetical protein